MLASIFFDAATREVNVIGDGNDNVAEFRQVNGNLYRATVDGISQDFSIPTVRGLVFIGYGGDDQFTNNTGVNGRYWGHNGNDIINGGSGNDFMNGGNGIDQLFGNDGQDHLRGAADRDFLFGGNGNDRLFGGSGLNQINGDAGDDEIYGGNDADTINGGSGIDKIYALAGDDIINSGPGGVPNSQGLQFADLVLGLDGNDTITGGGGLDVFWGGNGNDTLIGGAGENRQHGQNGNDQLTGGNFGDYLAGNNGIDQIQGLGGADYIFGGANGDILRGGAGNDTIEAGHGDDQVFGDAGNDVINGWIDDDTIDGGTGSDIAVLNRTINNYRITGQSGDLTVHDLSGFDGTNEVANVQEFRDPNGTHPARPASDEVVRIQPVVVMNTDRSNQAEFLGNAASESYIKQQIANIFAVADVTVEWLAPRFYASTFSNVGDSPRRPESDLNTIVQNGDRSGAGHPNSLVLDMYFVEVAPGFRDVGENTANGLAYVNANGIAAHVGDNLVGFRDGRDTVARVLAHEIAHNLGLEHVNDPGNLMDDGTALTSSQIQTILNSRFTRPT